MINPQIEADRRQAKSSNAEPKAATHRPVKFWPTFCFLFVMVPILVASLSVVLGAVLAGVEGWSWGRGFMYIISAVTATPLTSDSPLTAFGGILDCVIAIWSLAINGSIIGMTCLLPWMSGLVDSLNSRVAVGKDHHALGHWLVLCFFIGPVIMIAAFLVLAIPLSLAEGWDFNIAFLYICGPQLGLPNPLVPNSPTSFSGQAFDLLISCWGLALSNTVLGLIGGLVFNEVLATRWKNMRIFQARLKDGEAAGDTGVSSW